MAYNYAGQRAGRPRLVTWAEAGLALAEDLLAGNDDVRPREAGMLSRALTRDSRLRQCRTGAGRVGIAGADRQVASLASWRAAVEQGCDFAVAAKHKPRCGVPTP